jgi:hypothetical protein
VVQKGDTASFEGIHELGKLGQFAYHGVVKGGDFQASYKAAGDHGVFQMKRVK